MAVNHLGVRFISVQDQIDTDSPVGRAMFTIIGAMAELGSSLIVSGALRPLEWPSHLIGRKTANLTLLRKPSSAQRKFAASRNNGLRRAKSCCQIATKGNRIGRHLAMLLGYARYLSGALGQQTIRFETAGSSSSDQGIIGSASTSSSTGEHLQGRPLLTPDEIMRLGPTKPLILITGEPPYQLDRVNYLTDPAYAERFDPNPMHAQQAAQ